MAAHNYSKQSLAICLMREMIQIRGDEWEPAAQTACLGCVGSIRLYPEFLGTRL